MGDWFQLAPEVIWELGGALIPLAAGLLLAALILVPREQRGDLRRLTVFVAAFLITLAITWSLPEGPHGTWLRVVSIASLLLIIARSSVVLLIDTSVGKWLVPSMPRIVADVLQGLLYLGVGLLTLRAAGMEPSSLLTTSALLTAVVGLALQDTLGNLFSGLSLQVGAPFHVGDWIELHDAERQGGRVVEIGWRATRLLTIDEVEIVVPNGIVARAALRNTSRPTLMARRMVSFSASYETPPERVREVVLSAIKGAPHVLREPRPDVLTLDFGADGVHYGLWYATDDHGSVRYTDSMLRDRVWHALKRAGIVIPLPQRDLHLITRDPAADRAKVVSDQLSALTHVPMFEALGAELVAKLAQQASTRSYAEGELIVRQGEPGDELYVVRRGDVIVEAEALRGGESIELARLGPGEFFGEMSLLTGETRSATVRAGAGCVLVVVGHEAMQLLLTEDPDIAEHLSEVVVRRSEDRRSQVHAKGTASPAVVREQTNQLLRRIRTFFG